MAEVIMLPRRVPLPELSRDELLTELREKEDTITELAEEQLRVAEALWPIGDSERPAHLEEEGVTGDELIAGVLSLHEFCNRLINENYALRARLEGVQSVEGESA